LTDKDKALLEFTLQMINVSEMVIETYGNAYSALNDF